MVVLVQDGIDGGGEGVSLLLQGASAPSLDLVGAMDDVPEELADVVLDLGLGSETGIGGHLFADPTPDSLIRIEVGAVGRQTNQAEAHVGGGQVGPEGVAAVG